MKRGPRLASLAASAILLVSASACSSHTPEKSDAAVLDGTGGAISGGGGARAVGSQKPSVDAGFACGEGPDDVSVPCTDAGSGDMHGGGGTGGTPAPMPDARVPNEPDAALPLDDAGVDASMPVITTDEGVCAMRDMGCTFGQARTSVASATCTISGDSFSFTRDFCEVCNKSTVAYDFKLMVVDCGSDACEVFSAGGPYGGPLGAGACETRTDTADLSGLASTADCIDLYAYVGSGTSEGGGWLRQTGDRVRVCQCDRTTDTCITCENGACDP